MPGYARVPRMNTSSMPLRDTAAARKFASNADCWRAVQRRDREADGVFFYAVRTTGIYCRPSCAARRPLRANISFHASTAAARAAGFRPCKRCRPDEHAVRRTRPQLRVRVAFWRAPTSRSPSRRRRGRGHVALSLSARVQGRDGRSRRKATPRPSAGSACPRSFAAAARVTDAFYAAGFNSSSRFYGEARRQLGMHRSSFATAAATSSMRFAVGTCSLGAILVAASERGVCATAARRRSRGARA